MKMEWEEFAGGPNEPTNARIHVTLNKKNNLLINKKAFEVLGSPAAVKLLYERRMQTIGVRAAAPGEEKAFPLKRHPRGSHHLISARPFCRYYKINLPEPIKFTEPLIDNGILLLSLHKVEAISR